MRGFEPPRPEGHGHLKPARLPFRHIRVWDANSIRSVGLPDTVPRAELTPLPSARQMTRSRVGYLGSERLPNVPGTLGLPGASSDRPGPGPVGLPGDAGRLGASSERAGSGGRAGIGVPPA